MTENDNGQSQQTNREKKNSQNFDSFFVNVTEPWNVKHMEIEATMSHFHMLKRVSNLIKFTRRHIQNEMSN